jgi:hypothetical protein
MTHQPIVSIIVAARRAILTVGIVLVATTFTICPGTASAYGTFPEPGEFAGTGTSFDVNGIWVTTSVEIYMYLSVSEEMILAIIPPQSRSTVSIDFHGLPLESDHHIYTNTYLLPRVSRGATATISLILDKPTVLWIQPHAATVIIGGPDDQCSLYGIRDGNLCVLTSDIVDSVEIVADNQILDCNGHQILQDPAWPGGGFGVLINDKSGIIVHRCKIGASGQGFNTGLAIFNSQNTTIIGNTLLYSNRGILSSWISLSAFIGNHLSEDIQEGFSLKYGIVMNDIHNNAVLAHESGQARAFSLLGTLQEPSIMNRVYNNVFETSGSGISLTGTTENSIFLNNIFASEYELRILEDGWPNEFFHNNIQSSNLKVYAEQAAELSSGRQGNYWGRGCPNALFVPGTDSNRKDVSDSHAYGEFDGWAVVQIPGCPTDNKVDVLVGCLNDLSETIASLEEEAFDRNPIERKNALNEKISALQGQLEDGNYVGFQHKLDNDVRAKMDGFLGGNPSNDWIVLEAAQISANESIDCALVGDFDEDGLSYWDEALLYGTDFNDPDTDDDGIDDGAELAYWISRNDGIGWDDDVEWPITRIIDEPLAGDAIINLMDLDSDNDGLVDGAEILGWSIDMPTSQPSTMHVVSDPAMADTDHDGISDYNEFLGWHIDVNGESIYVRSNPSSKDTDGDGLNDFEEMMRYGSDPANQHTFGLHYWDWERADRIDSIGDEVTLIPLLLDGVMEPVYEYLHKHTPTISSTRSTSRRRVVFFLPPEMAGMDFTFHLESRDSTGDLDTNDSFNLITLKGPGEIFATPISTGSHTGSFTYLVDVPSAPGERANYGFYEFEWEYSFDDSESTCSYYASTLEDDYVPIAAHYHSAVEVSHEGGLIRSTDGITRLGIVGGAYASPAWTDISYVENVKVNGQLLHNRTYDRGDFQFPLADSFEGGNLPVGDGHTYQFDWKSLSGSVTPKLHFALTTKSMVWPEAFAVYTSEQRTKDYAAWEAGLPHGRAVLRRGKHFNVIVHSDAIGGDADNAEFIFYKTVPHTTPPIPSPPPPIGAIVRIPIPPWSMTKMADYLDERRGEFRERWQIDIPDDIAAGWYDILARNPDGTTIDFIKIGAIFDIDEYYGLTDTEIEGYLYDEDRDGPQEYYDPPYVEDGDRERDLWGAWFPRVISTWEEDEKYRQYLRPFDMFITETALLVVDGENDQSAALDKIREFSGSMIEWVEDDTLQEYSIRQVLSMADPSLEEARDGYVYPENVLEGQCMDFAALSTALARSAGIPARMVSGEELYMPYEHYPWGGAGHPLGHTAQPVSWPGAWDFHVWTEGWVPVPPTGTDHWYVYDSTDFVGCDYGSSSSRLSYNAEWRVWTAVAGYPGWNPFGNIDYVNVTLDYR